MFAAAVAAACSEPAPEPGFEEAVAAHFAATEAGNADLLADLENLPAPPEADSLDIRADIRRLTRKVRAAAQTP